MLHALRQLDLILLFGIYVVTQRGATPELTNSAEDNCLPHAKDAPFVFGLNPAKVRAHQLP